MRVKWKINYVNSINRISIAWNDPLRMLSYLFKFNEVKKLLCVLQLSTSQTEFYIFVNTSIEQIKKIIKTMKWINWIILHSIKSLFSSLNYTFTMKIIIKNIYSLKLCTNLLCKLFRYYSIVDEKKNTQNWFSSIVSRVILKTICLKID